MLLHLLLCLKVVNIKFGMFEHFHSALYCSSWSKISYMSRLQEKNVTTIVEVFEQQLLTFCLLKFLGCQSVYLSCLFIYIFVWLCLSACLSAFFLFGVLHGCLSISISIFYVSCLFVYFIYLYVSIFVIISICVFLLGCLWFV